MTPVDPLFPQKPVFLVPSSDNSWERIGYWGSPSGGGGGGGMSSPDITIPISKGISRWVEDIIGDWIDYLEFLTTANLLSGGEIIETRSGGAAGWLNGFAKGMAEIGGAMVAIGIATGNPEISALGGIGAGVGGSIAGLVGVGEWIGTTAGAIYWWFSNGGGGAGFVDP